MRPDEAGHLCPVYGVRSVARTAAALREQSDDLPLLWLSDDEKFGLAAFDLGVAMLLPLNCTDRELADGLRRCGVKERWEAMG